MNWPEVQEDGDGRVLDASAVLGLLQGRDVEGVNDAVDLLIVGGLAEACSAE